MGLYFGINDLIIICSSECFCKHLPVSCKNQFCAGYMHRQLCSLTMDSRWRSSSVYPRAVAYTGSSLADQSCLLEITISEIYREWASPNVLNRE